MSIAAADFGGRLEALDLSLFQRIPSQTSDNDRRSLLACQLATRERVGEYGYLEIGSYLGGSIQPHLVDSRCARIYSIDKRPEFQPDVRGTGRYKNNSTQRMLDLLADVDSERLDKLTCFDSDSADISPHQIEGPVQLCLIDGEHTDEAVVRDFEFCATLLDGPGVIIFHDAPLVAHGLKEIVARLKQRGQEFHAYNLPDTLMVFELGDFPVHQNPLVAGWLIDNYVGFLASIETLDVFRRWANLPPLRLVRNMRNRIKGNACE